MDFFARHNVRVHGISAATVAGEPAFGEVWPEVVRVVGGLPVVAHNAGFDSGAVREACGHSGIDAPGWEFRCSLAIARRHLDLESYRLPDVAGALGVELIAHHDAGADAAAAADIVVALAARVGVDSLAELERLGEVRPYRRVRGGSGRRQRRSAFPREELVMPEVSGGDPGHPLSGQVVVFTGELAAMSRQEAWDAIAACGATPARNVTRRTTSLVIGDGFEGAEPGAFTTVKARRVAELRAKGFQVEVMDERQFLACLDPVRHAVGPDAKRTAVIS